MELIAEQVGLNRVQVSWTAPPIPPSGGYRITAEPGGVSVDTLSSPHVISVPEPGLYRISVMYISQHFPGGVAGPQEVSVRGMYCTV